MERCDRNIKYDTKQSESCVQNDDMEMNSSTNMEDVKCSTVQL